MAEPDEQDEDSLSRLAMLSKRNALQPPHLKCSYTTELMVAPLEVTEQAMRSAKFENSKIESTDSLTGTRHVTSVTNKLVGELDRAESDLIKHTGLALHDIGNLRKRNVHPNARNRNGAAGFGNF